MIDHVEQQKSSFVVQEYITDPLLLPNGKRKFDIRCWVVVTDKFEAFFYKKGVVRTCSEPYDMHDFSNKVSHLSNHCLQEELSENFGKYEINNEIFFDEFEAILKESFCFELSRICEELKSVAALCLSCIKDKCRIYPDESMQFFQVFGFDYMLDVNGNVYLLEINGAPACAEKLKTEFVTDLIALQINPFFGLGDLKCPSNFEQILLHDF